MLQLNGDNKHLDERQKLIRGQVFQHMFVLLIILFVINGALIDSGIMWAESYFTQNFLLIVFVVTVGSIEEISRDAYFGFGNRIHRVRNTLILFGVLGIVIVSMTVFSWAWHRNFQSLIGRHGLTDNGSVFAMGLMYVTIAIFGWFKQRRNRKTLDKFEERSVDEE